MATFIVLGKFTQQGLQNAKDGQKRRAAARELLKSVGGDLKQSYLTMGQYDLVVIAEAPSNEVAAKVALLTGMQGSLTTQTLVAFDEAATDRLIESL